MQADLLFKKHTGLTKSKFPVPKAQGSFNTGAIKESKKEQVSGLNRMDFETFKLALADISTQLYSQYFHDAN